MRSSRDCSVTDVSHESDNRVNEAGAEGPPRLRGVISILRKGERVPYRSCIRAPESSSNLTSSTSLLIPARGRFWTGPVVRYLFGTGISLYGDWLTTVALLVLLFRATGSAAAPALYMLARVAPRVVGPTPGGVLTDRFDPVRVAVGCLLLQGLLTAAIAAAAGAGLIWISISLVAGSQFVNSVSNPAYAALPPRLTDSANLGRLNGLYAVLFASSILVSPAIGALLLPHTTPQLLIAADAVSFALSAFLIATLPVTTAPSSKAGVAGGARAGWSAIARDATLRSAAAAVFGNAAVITTLQAVLVVAAAERFHHDIDIGWLYAAVGAGGVVGGVLFLRPTPREIRRSEVVSLAIGEVLPVVAFVFTANLAVAIVLLFVSSLSATVYQVLGALALQQRVPIGVLGRASGATRVAMYTGMLIGAVAAVALVRPFGWQATVLLVCGFALVVLAAFSVSGPRDRSVAAPPPPIESAHANQHAHAQDSWTVRDQTPSSAAPPGPPTV